MLLKIEIFEKISNIYSSELTIDLKNKKTTYKKGDTTIQEKELTTPEKEIANLLKDYITYWKSEDSSPDTKDEGRSIDIHIIYEEHSINYNFQNEFPIDLEEFIKNLKNKVDIDKER